MSEGRLTPAAGESAAQVPASESEPESESEWRPLSPKEKAEREIEVRNPRDGA